jgi:hypothetical protein
VLSFMVDVEMEKKHALLAEPNVYRRAEALLEYFASAAGEHAGSGVYDHFPPRFSIN